MLFVTKCANFIESKSHWYQQACKQQQQLLQLQQLYDLLIQQLYDLFNCFVANQQDTANNYNRRIKNVREKYEECFNVNVEFDSYFLKLF